MIPYQQHQYFMLRQERQERCAEMAMLNLNKILIEEQDKCITINKQYVFWPSSLRKWSYEDNFLVHTSTSLHQTVIKCIGLSIVVVSLQSATNIDSLVFLIQENTTRSSLYYINLPSLKANTNKLMTSVLDFFNSRKALQLTRNHWYWQHVLLCRASCGPAAQRLAGLKLVCCAMGLHFIALKPIVEHWY